MEITTYTCTGCKPVDAKIIEAYQILVNTNSSVESAEASRVEAENARVLAEDGRVSAEGERTRVFSADHGTAMDDHTQAAEDHRIAGIDQATATEDHRIATEDHTTASGDHTTAGEDHAASTAATSRANAAAAAAEHQVDVKRGISISTINENRSPDDGGTNDIIITLDDGTVQTVHTTNGHQGNTGSSVDYPYELVNNLTTNDATKGLSAAQGVVLAGQVSQLEHKVDGTEDSQVSLGDAQYGKINGTSWSNRSSVGHYMVRVLPGENYRLTAGSGGNEDYAILSQYPTYDYGDHDAPSDGPVFSTDPDFSSLKSCTKNNSVDFTIPSDGVCLYMAYANINSLMKFGVDGLADKIEDIEESVDNKADNYFPLLYQERDYGVLTTGKFGTNYVNKHILIDVKENEHYILKSPSFDVANYAFVTGGTLSSGGNIPLVTGTSVGQISAGQEIEITIPSGCVFLLVYNGNNARPWYVRKYYDEFVTDTENTSELTEEFFGRATELFASTQISGAHLVDDGTTVAGTNYIVSYPIHVRKGQRLTGSCYIPKNGCAVALTDATGTTYNPVVTNGGTAGVKTIDYTVSQDGYIALSYITSQTHSFYLSAVVNISDLQTMQTNNSETRELVDEVYGKANSSSPAVLVSDAHLKDDGSTVSGTNYVICVPVALKKGQKVTTECYIPKNGCALALTDENSTSYIPVITNGNTGKVMTKEYVATEDCFVAWSYITSKTHTMTISAAVNMSEMYDLYTSISPNVKTGINDLNPFLEFQEKFIAAKKKTNDIEPLVLLAFSDIHGSALDNLPRIIQFADTHSTRIDEIVNLGDMVSNQFSNAFPFESIEGAGVVLNIIGNHDTADYSGGVYDWTAHAGLDAYNRYIAPFVDNWDVTQPTGAATNGYCYYYKDYSAQGIRIIFLDVMGYDATQEAWLESILADAKTNNLSVLIAAHYPPAKMVGFDGKYSLIEENLMNRPSYNVNYYTAINVVESFVSGGGELIGWVVGHRHADIIGKLDGTSQLCLIIDTAQFGSNSASPEYDKIEGTKTQDAFSAISIDTQAKTLATFKVGCRRDKWQRTRDSVCVNYETATILCEN